MAMRLPLVLVCLWAWFFPSVPAFSLPIEEDSVFARVIDSGAGLATVTRMLGGHYMVYDAGHWNGEGKAAFDGIKGVIPEGEEMDLLVLSHSDGIDRAGIGGLLPRDVVMNFTPGGGVGHPSKD